MQKGLANSACEKVIKKDTIPPMDKVRIDKWLWAARFYKTRSLATEEIQKGRISINDQVVKPAREVKVGDLVSIRREGLTRSIEVLAVSEVRGPAPQAQLLYVETPDSLNAKEVHSLQRRFAREPALSIENGRPTKRDRRDIEQAGHAWNDRWSASL
jgi:ribosome-associated heat shock protein Hsp15